MPTRRRIVLGWIPLLITVLSTTGAVFLLSHQLTAQSGQEEKLAPPAALTAFPIQIAPGFDGIVLIDLIDTDMASDKPGLQAILDSGASRLIPVAMAALTTILGMIPLLKDVFFVSMAVTIMFGLGFATILTLIFVPVLYAIFFGVKS